MDFIPIIVAALVGFGLGYRLCELQNGKFR
jgi:hypothetical protein